ncbi:MAG: DUF3006 domain-containing protein [Clostridia bacterium]|nr:DUF3006 domain-containing protein [Clostridia bacterium]
MCTQTDEYYVLDRREGEVFVLVGRGGELNVTELPGEPREGDVFILGKDGFIPCPQERARRERRIKNKMLRLFKRRS